MHLDTFTDTFLNIDFDNLLIEQDNYFINSNEHYLEYKNLYIETTKLNYDNLTKLLELIEDKNKNDHINKKYTFHIINTNLHNNVIIDIKNIIIKQNELYNNLISHINFLNNIKNNNNFKSKQILSPNLYTNVSSKR